MATLAVQHPTRAGTTFTKGAAAALGDEFPNSGREVLHVTNAHAADPRTVTIAAQAACEFGTAAAAHNVAVVVPALTTKVIGPFSARGYNDADGNVQVTYSNAAADLTVAVEGL